MMTHWNQLYLRHLHLFLAIARVKLFKLQRWALARGPDILAEIPKLLARALF